MRIKILTHFTDVGAEEWRNLAKVMQQVSDETENENGLWSTALLFESIDNTAMQKQRCC